MRGAYLEKEKKMAKLNNYPCPINDSYEDTGKMYLKVIDYLKEKSGSYVVIATHNEQAVQTLVTQVNDNCKAEIAFAQIYGMGEQITMPLGNIFCLLYKFLKKATTCLFQLAQDGFIVYKSVPYGPLHEVLPYLSRRVAENRAVLSGARKERQLLAAEIKRRISQRNFNEVSSSVQG